MPMVVVFLGPLKTFGKTTRIKISKKNVFACDRPGHVGLLLCNKKFIPPPGGAILVVENAIFILWPLKWRHQVAKINICFIQTTLNFLT